MVKGKIIVKTATVYTSSKLICTGLCDVQSPYIAVRYVCVCVCVKATDYTGKPKGSNSLF